MMHLGIGLQHALCPQRSLLVTVRYRKESRKRMLETRGRGEQKKGGKEVNKGGERGRHFNSDDKQIHVKIARKPRGVCDCQL